MVWPINSVKAARSPDAARAERSDGCATPPLVFVRRERGDDAVVENLGLARCQHRAHLEDVGDCLLLQSAHGDMEMIHGGLDLWAVAITPFDGTGQFEIGGAYLAFQAWTTEPSALAA